MFSDHRDSLTTRQAPYVRTRLAAAALALSISLGGAATIAAQDATPSTGGDVACTAPNVATPSASGSPTASPEAQDLTAAPVVDDQAVIDDLTAVVTTCAPEGAADLEVLAVYGFADGRYAIDYQYLNGAQVVRKVDSYSNQTGSWVLENQATANPETDLDTITVSVKFGAEAGLIELSPGQFPVQPAIKFHAANQGADTMAFALYSGTEDFDAASVAGQATADVEDTLEPLGSSPVMAGTESDILFEGLEPGPYVIVVYDASGVADSAALVTVDEPMDLGVPDVVGGGGSEEATPAS